jgi:hypothetical protein
MIGNVLGWCIMLAMVGADVTNVHAYIARLGTRPAVARALGD